MEDTGRRRSSRLAAKGVTTTPRAEPTPKKTAKSVEKPTPNKRAKRKIADVILPEAKKTKTVEEKKLPETANENNIEENNTVAPMEVEENESLASSKVEQNDEPAEDKKIETPLKDATSEIVENNLTADVVEKETEQVEEVSEVIEEPIVQKDNTEPLKNNDVSLDADSKPEPPINVVESNGTDEKQEEEKEIIEIVEEKINNDIDAAKEVTSNGDTTNEIKSNGNESELVEQNAKVIETDLKAAVTATTPASPVIIKELDELERIDLLRPETVNVTVTSEDKTPSVEQSTTVMS